MLSGAKHPRKLSHSVPLWAFDEILRLRLSPRSAGIPGSFASLRISAGG